MDITKAIKTLLVNTDKKQADLMPVLKVNSKQALSNKMLNKRWSAEEAAAAAEACGAKLCIIQADGFIIPIDATSDSKTE